jgi:hypothetical protein
MGVVICQAVIDCIDPEAVAAFLAAALGWRESVGGEGPTDCVRP